MHNHVVEFEEGQTIFHTLLVASCTKHVVHREAGADVPDKVNVIQVTKPVGIVYHHGFSFTEFNEFAHLLLEAFAVMIDRFGCHHGSHITSSGRIPDHAGSTANQSDRLISCHLQSLH